MAPPMLLVSDLRPLLVEPLSLVLDASTPDLEVLLASEAWAAMYGRRTTPSLQEQFGPEMLEEFRIFLAHVLRRCSASAELAPRQAVRGCAKFRKMAGKDPDGTWFRATLMVTVPPRREEASSSGVFPVVISLERKKRKNRAPRRLIGAAPSPACDTILEDDEEGNSTDMSSSRSTSHQSSYFSEGSSLGGMSTDLSPKEPPTWRTCSADEHREKLEAALGKAGEREGTRPSSRKSSGSHYQEALQAALGEARDREEKRLSTWMSDFTARAEVREACGREDKRKTIISL